MIPTPEKDYTHQVLLTAAVLVALLVLGSFIPPRSIGGVELRRANILSELLTFDDSGAAAPARALFDEEDFRIDMHEVAARINTDTAARKVPTTYAWRLTDSAAVRRPAAAVGARGVRGSVPIETFDSAGAARLAAFCDTLLEARRPVRIAFLGDSFVEGDILTADLRDRLQSAYGGSGPGFAPMASPLTAFRRTVRTQSKGWTAYNIMQRRSTPEALRRHYFLSGWVCRPEAGASTRWETTDFRPRLDSCTTARILFISPRTSRVELTLNDTLRRSFRIEGDPAVRQVVLSAPRLRSVEFRVLSGTDGFVGYGAVLEGGGVTLDNYSIRSNNGQAMFWTNPSVVAQIDALASYDLVILQYGLNIMQRGVSDYASYGRQIEKMVAYVRECMPRAAVLVMGVSDRSVKTDSGFEPMDAIPHMTEYQRRAAAESGAAFWPTADAMRAEGGMERFVGNGWAGKDFTHINYAGGRRVAWALADALDACVAKERARREALRASKRPPVVDTLRRARMDRRIAGTVEPVQTIGR